MRTSEMVKSKFFRGKDLTGQPAMVLTIADVSEELMDRSKHEVKAVLWFNETLKGLRLNATSVAVLEAAYGPDSDLWNGKRVRLSFDPNVMFGGQRVGGVTVQTPAGAVYSPGPAISGAAWGDAPAAPAGAPVPVLNQATGEWELPPQTAAPAAQQPPTPVLNPNTGQWELPAQKHVPPLTLGQRVARDHPPAETFDKTTGEVYENSQPLPQRGNPNADFNDDIPF